MAGFEGAALRALLAHFKIEVDSEELKKAEKEIEGFKEVLENAGKAAKAFIAYETIKQTYEFVKGAVEAGVQLKVMAERLGTGTGELQALHLAAGEADVSVGAMDASLRFLNRTLGDGGKHSAAAKAEFTKLGIAVKDSNGHVRPAADIMGDVADKIASIEDPAKKTKLAIQLLGRGGDQLIPLLNKGKVAFDEARKSMEELGGGIEEDFIEQAEKASKASTHLDFAWTGLKTKIAGALLPGFIQVVTGLAKVVGSFIDIEKKSHVFESAFSIVKIALIVGAIMKIKSALDAVTMAQIKAFLTNPITLWIAAIALAILIYNDLQVALEGGESIFGDLFGQTGIEQLGEDLESAKTAADLLWTALKSVYEILNGIANIALGGIESAFGAISGLFGGKGSAKEGSDAVDYGVDQLSKATGSNWDEAKKRALDRSDAHAPVGKAAREAQIEEAQAKYRGTLPTNGLGQAANASGPSIVQNNEVKIENHLAPGTDPKAVGDATKEAVDGSHARFKNNANRAMQRT